MYHVLFIHSSIDRHMGRFLLWAIMNLYKHSYTSYCIDKYLQFSCSISRRIAGSHDNMSNLLKNYQAIFQSSYTILRSYQQWMRVPISLHPHQHLLLSVSILAILVSVKWYVMDLISLMTKDADHLFMILLARWTNVYSNLFPIFKLSVLNTYLLSAL